MLRISLKDKKMSEKDKEINLHGQKGQGERLMMAKNKTHNGTRGK